MKTKMKESVLETGNFEIFDKISPANKIKEQNQEKVYPNIITSWKNRRTRYSSMRSYYGSSL